MQDTSTGMRSSCWLAHFEACGALWEPVLGLERNSSPPRSDLFPFMLILVNIYFVVINFSVRFPSRQWLPLAVVCQTTGELVVTLLDALSVWTNPQRRPDKAFSSSPGWRRKKVCQHREILPLLLGGARTRRYSEHKSTSTAIFPQTPAEGWHIWFTYIQRVLQKGQNAGQQLQDCCQ